MTDNRTAIYLTDNESLIYIELQKNYELIERILRIMQALKIDDLRGCNVSIDFDLNGIVNHTSITKHSRGEI